MFKSVLRVIIVTLSICSLPLSAQAASWCKLPGKINIKIIPEMSQLKYDYTKSFTDLSKVKLNSTPYGSKAITHTFGLANGQFRIEHKVRFQLLTNPNTNETCIWYDSIDVNMKMNPLIMIAKEYRKGGCHFKEVMVHEQQHIAVDKQVTNEYAQKLGQTLLQEVTKTSLYGPFPSSQTTFYQNKMQDTLNKLVTLNNDAMMTERSKRQAVIDSKTNYDAISKKLHDVCDKKSPLTVKRVQKKLKY